MAVYSLSGSLTKSVCTVYHHVYKLYMRKYMLEITLLGIFRRNWSTQFDSGEVNSVSRDQNVRKIHPLTVYTSIPFKF